MTMAFEEIKKKGMMDISGMEGEVGLVAGRSQREKRRSYKDLLREEEEIAAQVLKTSKKHHKDSDLFLLGGDSHKKKKKHLSDDYYHRDHHSSGQPPHKKKRKSSDHSLSLSSSSSSHPSHSTDTAMGLLEAITSPLATGTDPTPHFYKKPSYPPHTSSHSSKDRKQDSGSKSSHSFSHSRPPGSSSSKKHSSSSKSLLFHGGAGKGEPLTLCEAEGLKMKLILSSKEKNEGVGTNEGFSFPVHSSSSSGVVGHHSSSSSKKGGMKKEKDKDKMMPKPPKKKQHSREPLPVVGKEVEVVGHYGGMGGDSSSSGGELEAGELVIDDSYTHLSKKKKKSKKSKKKKDRERDREKGSREKKHSKGSGGKKSCPVDQSRSHSHTHSSSNHSSAGGMYAMAPPTSSHHHQSIELMGEKKKKKEEKEKEKHDKDKPKKKNMTAYQVFCKEYRVNINAEQPGLVFGELSKKLAEVWKQLPEKDKLVWRQKAQYLQHKQNKAEAMTVKRKTLTTSDSKSKSSSKGVSLGAGLAPQGRSSLGMSLSPVRVPDVDPIDAAAHLQLLGESLSLIGHRLQETEGMVAVSGSLSVLLDSILCALGPLTCLTAQVPQLNGCPRNVLSNTLDNIAYIMPGL
ncbi:HMG domain-containing protein 4a isoform X2 [Rhinichthys klamathensis goyatoka]|uniref:HMG domain-containing protein 4a isoform X2 n=1 Tax=Rhinichthys klamathensis goyatoka TaxID=3034132 RepID=UPI0024B533B2|nr:HMG domain-containing protein 4a isoform X2 [Rhinichthys klamathensis goyatoka]